MSDSATAFDAKLAKSPTRVLKLDQVIDLLSVTHAPERVEEYRQAMLRGDRFPPVSVVKLAGRYFVADGHKRLCAYKTLGGEEVVVEVWPISRWIGDQQRQLGNNLRRQVPALFRAITGRAEKGEGREVLRHFAQHWSRIARSLFSRARAKERS